MVLRGIWRNTTVDLPSASWTNQIIDLSGCCDSLSLRLKALLSGSVAINSPPSSLAEAYKALREVSGGVLIDVTSTMASASKSISGAGNVPMAITQCSTQQNKGIAGRISFGAHGTAKASYPRFASSNAGVSVHGIVSARVSQLRERLLSDLSDTTLGDLSHWTLRDWYYIEVES